MKNLHKIIAHADRVWTVDYSSSNKMLASASSDKTVKIWKKKEEEWLLHQQLDSSHTKTIRTISFSNDGTMLALGSFDATVSIFKLNQQHFYESTKLTGHQFQVKCVAWQKSGTRLASCSRDKNIWIWMKQQHGDDFICFSVLSGHSQDVKYIKWFDNEPALASCSYDNSVKIWKQQGDDFICCQTLETHTSTVWSCDIGEEGNLLVTVSDDVSVGVFRRQDKTKDFILIKKIEDLHYTTIYSCALRGDLLLTVGSDMLMVCVDVKELKEQWRVEECHSGEVNGVRWMEEQVVTCSDDRSLKIWEKV